MLLSPGAHLRRIHASRIDAPDVEFPPARTGGRSRLPELAVAGVMAQGLQELAAIRRLRLIHQRPTLDQLTGRVSTDLISREAIHHRTDAPTHQRDALDDRQS